MSWCHIIYCDPSTVATYCHDKWLPGKMHQPHTTSCLESRHMVTWEHWQTTARVVELMTLPGQASHVHSQMSYSLTSDTPGLANTPVWWWQNNNMSTICPRKLDNNYVTMSHNLLWLYIKLTVTWCHLLTRYAFDWGVFTTCYFLWPQASHL